MLNFDTIPNYTSTVIVSTNLSINFEWLFNSIEIFPIHPKKPIRKTKQLNKYVKSINPPEGSCILIEYHNHSKGYKIRKKETKQDHMNSIGIVFYFGKLITIRVPNQGKIHLTGCLDQNHAVRCVQHLWRIINTFDKKSKDTFTLTGEDKEALQCEFRTEMENISFFVDFEINLETLSRHTNENTRYATMFEYSMSTAANIKSEPINIHDGYGKYIQCMRISTNGEQLSEHSISYNEYIKNQPKNKQKKESRDHRKNTFLVFQSGSIIMSGLSRHYMKDDFNNFVDMLFNIRPKIEERVNDIL